MKLKISICIGAILLFVVATISVTTLRSQSVQDSEQKITVEQLQSENGVIPVEIQSPQANFKTQNAVENIAFVVKNNTNKKIVAICLAYSIQIERNKIESKDTFFHTVETFVHKDIFLHGTKRDNSCLFSILEFQRYSPLSSF